MRMTVCYLDCHEAGLCCYLVIHIENLLRPLQLFYFHLCPIYWLSVVHKKSCITFVIELYYENRNVWLVLSLRTTSYVGNSISTHPVRNFSSEPLTRDPILRTTRHNRKKQGRRCNKARDEIHEGVP
jgi:hypothetical protein